MTRPMSSPRPANELPPDYPFDLGAPGADHRYTGPLQGAEVMVYDSARSYRRAGLRASDFAVAEGEEEFHLNAELAQLRNHVRRLAEALKTEGPWNGIDLDGDVCRGGRAQCHDSGPVGAAGRHRERDH